MLEHLYSFRRQAGLLAILVGLTAVGTATVLATTSASPEQEVCTVDPEEPATPASD